MPVGASAALFQFARVLHSLISLARALFHLPVQNYLDDFWCAVPEEVAVEAFSAFKFLLTDRLGFKLKDKKQLKLAYVGPPRVGLVQLREGER